MMTISPKICSGSAGEHMSLAFPLLFRAYSIATSANAKLPWKKWWTCSRGIPAANDCRSRLPGYEQNGWGNNSSWGPAKLSRELQSVCWSLKQRYMGLFLVSFWHLFLINWSANKQRSSDTIFPSQYEKSSIWKREWCTGAKSWAIIDNGQAICCNSISRRPWSAQLQ